MTDVDPQAVPSDEAWQALRTLLSGTSKEVAPSEELARAAMLGQVEVLALDALPALDVWLEGAVRQRDGERVAADEEEGGRPSPQQGLTRDAGRQRIARRQRIAPNCARACSSRDATMFVGVFSARIGRERSQW